MKEPTNSELYRGIEEIKEHNQEMLKVQNETLLQTTKTNGRVTSLEKLTTSHATIIDSLVSYRWIITGGIAVIIFLQGGFLLLYKLSSEDIARNISKEIVREAIEGLDIDKKIQHGIIQALDNYDIK